MLIGAWKEQQGAQILFKKIGEGGAQYIKGTGKAVCEVCCTRGSLLLTCKCSRTYIFFLCSASVDVQLVFVVALR